MKKIMCVSLIGKTRFKSLAVWDGDLLIFHEITPIKGVFERWKPPLMEEMESRSSSGASVYIEDRSGSFGDLGFQFTLDAIDSATGRTYQSIAMDEYYGLVAMSDASGARQGNIIVGKGLERVFFNENTVNITADDKGRNKYDIDPAAFTGQHRVMLMSVLAAKVFHTPTESDFARMLGLSGFEDAPMHVRSLQAIAGRGRNAV